MESQINQYPGAASRSWLEMNVRTPMVLCMLTTILVISMSIYEFSAGMNERRLITSGVPVQAKVVIIGLKKDRKVPLDENTFVQLQYPEPRTGQMIAADGTLPRKPGASVSLDDIIPIKVDPDNAYNWTALTEAPSMLLDQTIPLVLLPIIPLTLWLTLRQRSRVLKVLKTGQIKKAVINKIQHSSIAPMSNIIGLTVEGTDRTVRYAYWAKSGGEIKLNDTIDVIDNGTGLPIPAKPYQAQ